MCTPSSLWCVLLTKYYSCDQIKKNEMGEHVARMGARTGAYRLLVGKPEGMRPLGRPRRRWLDCVENDLQEVGWGTMDWVDLAEDGGSWRAVVSAVMNHRVALSVGYFLTSWELVSFKKDSAPWSYVYIYIYIYIYICVCVCVCVYIYIFQN